MNRQTTKRGVVFRCDAGDLIGGGHAMRCLTLANALAEDGATITFVAASMPDLLAHRIEGCGHRLVRIPDSPELQRPAGNWEEPPLSDDAQLADAKATGAAVSQADWLVVDHYLLDVRWHSAARDFAGQILVIDDLANRSYDCDILLDQTFGRAAEDYRNRIPVGAKVLAGSAYALLRPEFARERGAALERRKKAASVRRILVSMGTSDTGGITARIVEDVLAAAPECAIDAVVGLQAPSLDRLRRIATRQAELSIHVNSEQMATLMLAADVAVGAAGSTSWERCCLGLPSIALVLAENQRIGASTLSEAGAAITIDNASALAPTFEGLLADPYRLARMSAAAFAIADGLGTGRVVESLTCRKENGLGQLKLRQALGKDIEALWLWRNDPLMRSMAKTQDPVSWNDHRRWFDRVLNSPETDIYIADLSDEPAAMVRFDRHGDHAVVSINVAPQLRGRGVGKAALEAACRAYQEVHPGSGLRAEVRHSNIASRRAFLTAGFEQLQSNDPLFANFVRTPDKPPPTDKKVMS